MGRQFLVQVIDVIVVDAQDTADILQHDFGRQCRVGADLCDMVAAVFLGNVFDDFVSPQKVEIFVHRLYPSFRCIFRG